jgi:type I restriction enzyme S subunit
MELPRGWTFATLADVARLGSGGTPRARTPRYYGGDIPWAVIGDLNDGVVGSTKQSLTAAGLAESAAKVVPGGTVLLAMYGSIGKLGISAMSMATNQAIATLQPDEAAVTRQWLFWYLRSQRSHLERGGKGATQKNISQSLLRKWPVPLPPLDEQDRIVSVLENHFSRVDAGRDYTHAARCRAGRWERAALDAALSRSAAGSVPLRQLVARVEAGKSFGGSAPPATENEWGVVRVSAMTWGEFRPDENKSVSAERVDPRHEIRPGDVLVSRANTTDYVGAPVFVRQTRPGLLLSDKSLRLVPVDGVDRAWLAEALGTRTVRRQMSALATGTKDSMRNISQANLLSVSVPATPHAKQAEVVHACAAIREEAARLAAALSAADLRAHNLRRRLLSAAFRGEL